MTGKFRKIIAGLGVGTALVGGGLVSQVATAPSAEAVIYQKQYFFVPNPVNCAFYPSERTGHAVYTGAATIQGGKIVYQCLRYVKIG